MQWLLTNENPALNLDHDGRLTCLAFCRNIEHNVLICISCGHAYPPSGVLAHAKGHKIIGAKSFIPALYDLVLERGISHSCQITNPPRLHAAPVSGLLMYNGFRCPVQGCDGAAGMESTMEEHYRLSHQKHEIPSRGPGRLLPSKVQSFFTGRKRKWFAVNVDLIDIPNVNEDMYARIVQEYIPRMQPRLHIVPTLNRDRTMLAQLTDWDKHLGPFITTTSQCARVMGLIRPPVENKEPELFPVIDLFRRYMGAIEKLLGEVPVLVRRILHKYPLYVCHE